MLAIKECKNRAGKKAVDWKHVQVYTTRSPRNALTDQSEDFTIYNLNFFCEFLTLGKIHKLTLLDKINALSIGHRIIERV